jgi:hypothetical protein
MRSGLYRPAQLVGRIVFAVLLAAPLLALSAQAAPSPIDGVVASIEGSTLMLTGANGETSPVLIQPDALILGRKPSTLATIKPGEAMGVTATRGSDGSLTATVINVFTPELWNRVRKGQWDMATPGQVMTNAEVDRMVDKVEGHTLYMKYEMLDAAITVPDDAEIWRMVPLMLSDIKPGAKVSVRTSPSTDGNLHAAMISYNLP